MNTTGENWTISVGSASAAASRWLSAMSLLTTAMSLFLLYVLPPSEYVALVGLSVVVGLGLIQLCLAVRIEFDVAVFTAVAVSTAMTQEFDTFDRILKSLRLRQKTQVNRTLEDRAYGVMSLVRSAAIVAAAQIVLTIVVRWLIP